MWIKSIHEIRSENLIESGIRGVILDLDNTLIHWGFKLQSETVTEELASARSWICSLTSAGLKVCIVSNNAPARVKALADIMGVPALAKAGKPRRRAFLKALDLMCTGTADTICIGDQVFTDVFGANRIGLRTILVAPLTKREFIGTRILRIFEFLVLCLLRQRGWIKLSSFR
ncbi:MAG TPA: YqeG family HAD IIIA-type phosphatase [Clostridia bacterium]|nr:YqeG family HAD IIIA-type phosphatase [Clostridia bacterium]